MLRSRISTGLVAAARAEVRVAPRAAAVAKVNAARAFSSRPSVGRVAMLAPVGEWFGGGGVGGGGS